ncbi:hypothetical protein [Paenibacillus sp. Marseille-Q4541]|uniref:hypothetical protein n=1 Tax=Paenibacillus sp. Marseille-Q4541 TaxID=2831522 RepID=UPI001BA54C0F|nr:hypothetical protein [Paenibacillus sp. Marseille-Q4541]
MTSRGWKQAWWVAKSELKRDRLNWIWTILFTLYTAAISGSFISGIGTRTVEDKIHTVVSDNMFLFFVPYLGFFLSRRSFRYLQDDSYTQMLSYMRRLPIPAVTILWNRIFQMLITFVVNSVFFFTVIYFLVLRAEHFRLDQVLAFALLWIGYGVILNSFFIYWEFLVRGKVYFIFSMLGLFVIILCTIVTAILDWNLIQFTVDHSKQWGLLAPGMWIMILAGILMMALVFQMVKRQLLRRDLS